MLHQEFIDNQILFKDNGKTVLTIVEEETDAAMQIALCGALVSESANGILDELGALVSVGVRLDVNFSQVSHISPTAMNVFLSIQQTIDRTGKGELLLHQIPADILSQFDRVGMTDLLDIED